MTIELTEEQLEAMLERAADRAVAKLHPKVVPIRRRERREPTSKDIDTVQRQLKKIGRWPGV